MLERTNTADARWYIVEGNDKRRARLNCTHHLIKQIPYEEVPQEEVPQKEVALPERANDTDYERKAVSPDWYVPKVYG